MLKKNTIDLNITNEEDASPLHIAISLLKDSYYDDGDPEEDIQEFKILQFLLAQPGINFNKQDQTGNSLFHYICDMIRFFAPKMLTDYISRGADITLKNQDDKTPINNAFESLHHELDIKLIKLLLNQPGVDKISHTLLQTACENINSVSLDIFKQLIVKNGADINKTNDGLLRALIDFDSAQGDDDILKLLLKQPNIDFNQVDSEHF